jgi:hypothetical protein
MSGQTVYFEKMEQPLMTQQNYYGQNFEGTLITGICIVIVLCMMGAWTLMSSGLHGCKVSDYTYCGDPSEPEHAGPNHK